ncbi:MAG: hypothetical protein V5A77_00555 [Candidatus Bipolaricaulota bacterium]|nr:hypothetical protein [Candidatus Bipolaricaulota bacterium]MBS3791070.1 hypothetical protein [Candidatus Bipolaricaulota bacterium]
MNKCGETVPSVNPINSMRIDILLFIGLFALGLLVLPPLPVRARIDGEVDTELWLGPGGSLLGENSVTNFRVDYLEGNLTDYPSQLTTALYWPNTTNTLFDTGLALSGDIEAPLISATSGLDDFKLKLDGFFAEDFGPDYPVGTAGGSSRVYLSEEEMDYWVTKGIINYGGFSYRGVFLSEEIHESSPAILKGVSKQVILGTKDKISVEGRTELEGVFQNPDLELEDISAETLEEILKSISEETLTEQLGVDSNYGAGLELALSGMKISGVSVELKTRLGLVPNPPEMVGDNPGSGYDVFDTDGRYVGYTGSEVEINGIELGPIRLDTANSFTAEDGYEKTEVDFWFEESSGIIEFEGTMTYSARKKTLSLEPSLNLEWACFDVYSEMRPNELTEEESQITGINLKGYGVNGIQLGNVRASFIQALGNNRLQRLRGRDDWRLRASDYDLTTEAEFSYEERSFAFGQTDYEGALSLEGGGGNLELALDAYWGSDPGLFGFSELTSEASYRLSNSFELVTGLVLAADEGVQDVILNTIYKW